LEVPGLKGFDISIVWL